MILIFGGFMLDLEVKIYEMKSNLMSKNIKYIRKCNYKTIPIKEEYRYNEDVVKIYNYYVKLINKLKKYIKDSNYIDFYTKYDKFNNLVCLVTKFDVNEIDINIPIDIRVIIGDKNDTYIRGSYYEGKCGILYLEEFSSGSRRNGYGSMLLENLNYIVDNINNKLSIHNKCNKSYNFKLIKLLKGRAIPFKSVISQEDLNRLYLKYGFKVDEDNYLLKNRE